MKLAKTQENKLSRVINSTRRIIERDVKILNKTRGEAHLHAYEFILNNWSTIDLLVLCAQNTELQNGIPKHFDNNLTKALRNSVASSVVKFVYSNKHYEDKTKGKIKIALECNHSRLNQDTKRKIKSIKENILKMSFIERYIKASNIEISTTNLNTDINRYTAQILIEHGVKNQIDNVSTFDFKNAVKSDDLYKRTSLLSAEHNLSFNLLQRLDNAPKPKCLTLN